jgi:hypothetical protein
MDAGRLTVSGQTEAAANVKLEWKPEEETVDAFGNVVKIKQQKKSLNNKEKKKVRRRRLCCLLWLPALPLSCHLRAGSCRICGSHKSQCLHELKQRSEPPA